MNELWSHLYYQNKGINELPPTSEVIKSHILRAYIATKKMFQELDTVIDNPDPTLFQYVLDNELQHPEFRHNPLPEKYTVRCGCETASCSCKRNGVICTKFCDCSLQEEFLCMNV